MQDLRDKLLKAGLASKKEARKARTESRRDRKKKGGTKADEQARREQEERYQQKQAEQTRASQERQQQINRERAEHERESRIQDLIRAHAVLKPLGKDRPFYFVRRDGRVGRFHTTYELATRLSSGQLAIVELSGDPDRDFAVIDAETAGRLEELEAADRILFWCRPGPDGTADPDLPTHGAR